MPASTADTTRTGTTGSGTGAVVPMTAPTGLQVHQGATGEIVFSWDAVPGAKHYQVGRTIGVASTDPRDGRDRGGFPRTSTEPRFSDREVRVGERYVYTVAAVDSADRRGPIATATEFRPRALTEFGRPPAPVQVEARAMSDDAVTLRWRTERGAGASPAGEGAKRASFEIAHVENDGAPRVLATQSGESAEIPGLRAGRHQFLVTTLLEGKRSDPARSNVVTLPRAGAADPSAGNAPPDAQVVVTKGDPIVLRIGATASLAARGQSGWTSLATAVATVDASGVVSARAAGDTQLVRVVPDAGSVVRVTVVSVRVTP